MSIPGFAWALECGAALALLPADRLVLIYLADKANGIGVCWPGQETICRFTGLSLRTVRTSIHRLAKLGPITLEEAPGLATRYIINRELTPANGNGVNGGDPGKPAQGYPGNMHPPTPANGTGAPRQNSTPHPGKSCTEPRQMVHATPANRCPEPLREPLREPKRRASAPEAGKILSFPEKAGGTPPPEPRADDFNAWVDGLPKRTQPLVVGQEVVRGELVEEDDNPPVDPGTVLAVLDDLKRSMRMKAYPPRAASLAPDEQAEALCPRRPQARYLPDATLRAARADLAARAAARGVVP